MTKQLTLYCITIIYNASVHLRNKKLSFRRDSGRRRLLRHTRSFEVRPIDVGTNRIRNPVCDFLWV